MGKLSQKNIKKLIEKGRLVPIIKSTNEGKHLLVGYRRKSTSRKSSEVLLLPEPEEIKISESSKNS